MHPLLGSTKGSVALGNRNPTFALRVEVRETCTTEVLVAAPDAIAGRLLITLDLRVLRKESC